MRLIDADGMRENLLWCKEQSGSYKDDYWDDIIERLDVQPTVELVRCKDCKHRGIQKGKTAFDIEWPDSRCPCQCSDPYYSWVPPDDWYCANGERMGGEHDAAD